MRKIGSTQKKILLLLLGGITLGVNRSPHQSWRIIKAIHSDWQNINRQALERAINGLYTSKLVGEITNQDGSTTLILSESGKKRAIKFDVEKMKIKRPAKWDRKWRIVISDVPERLKKLRNSLRFHLQSLEFYPLQKSVFVHPFDCSSEVEFITEWHRGKKYVRFIIAESIDNELELKKHFDLI